MNNFLFFNYAKLKGYTFEMREESTRKAFGQEITAKEKLIFANYKGKMVGAVQINSVNLPVAVYKEMGFKDEDFSKASPLITYFFINAEKNLRRDIITTGLLLTLQEYALEAGNKFCVGYSYDCFNEELQESKMKLFEVNHHHLVKCKGEIEKLIKNSGQLNLSMENPFIWNINKPLITFRLGKQKNQTPNKVGTYSSAA